MSDRNFDQKARRQAWGSMIRVDGLPLKLVKNEGFQKFMSAVCPQFVVPSRGRMRKDCLGLHFNEKAKLKAYFKESKQMICLTTDMWTSGQKVDYLRFTSHFIDDDWKLRKEVLDFIPCSNHKGDELGQLLEKCLNEWGIDKILAMTTENLSSSDKTVGHLAQRIVTKGMTILGGQHLHIRCVAHIVDLAVMDVLSNFKSSIGRIRTVVRYIKRSPVRLKKFEDFVVEERIESHKSLHLDVPTKWNSVYLMLETAIIYQSAFERYETSDADFRGAFMPGGKHVHIGLPTKADWSAVKKLVQVLVQFDYLAKRVSGTQFLTSNEFFDDIVDVYEVIMMFSKDKDLEDVASCMKTKFDKYWKNIETTNILLFVSAILDPRRKLDYVEYSLKCMYGDECGARIANLAKDALSGLFNEYKSVHAPPKPPVSDTDPGVLGADSTHNMNVVERIRLEVKAEKRWRKLQMRSKQGTELEKYLGEGVEPDEKEFNLLRWWKMYAIRFPVLTRLARDVLAMPISTMVSESTFSTGGRVVSDFRFLSAPRSAMEEEVELLQTVENEMV